MATDQPTTQGAEVKVDVSFKGEPNDEFNRFEKLTRDLLRVPKEAIRKGGSSTSR
jgi:hypothetical protein